MKSFAWCLLVAALPAFAQGFPSRTVRFVVTNAPGIGADGVARAIAHELGPRTGQAFVVENRVGADGAIGMEFCAKAPPDGHTLCVTAQGALVVNPLLRSNLPYNTARDFLPVIHLGYFDSVLITNPKVPARNFQELADLARAKPDAVTWGVFSYTSSGFMYADWLRRSRGTAFYVVPYKTTVQMLQAVINGEVNAGVYAVGQITPQIAAGKLRALAITSDSRHPLLPDVPTFSELGIKLPLRSWYGIVTAAGTPRDTVRWLNTEIGKLAEDAEFRGKFLTGAGILYSKNTPEEFAALMQANRESMAELLRFLEVKPQ